jgi:fructokinase
MHVVHECLRLADLVRLSEEDVGAWEGATGEDLLAVARAAADRPVLVTRGGRGSTLYGPGAPLEVPGRSVRVVDTVGAGDAYMAGLLVVMAERDGLEALRRGGTPDRAGWRAMMEFATATAALTCQRQGAHPPARAEVNEALGAEGLAGVGA